MEVGSSAAEAVGDNLAGVVVGSLAVFAAAFVAEIVEEGKASMLVVLDQGCRRVRTADLGVAEVEAVDIGFQAVVAEAVDGIVVASFGQRRCRGSILLLPSVSALYPSPLIL